MGTANSAPSGGISQLQSQYGGTGMAAGPYGDTEDPEIIVGRRDLRGEYLRAGVEPGRVPERLPNVPQTKRQSELEKEFWSRPEDDLPELQRRLWAGGFYPPGADPTEIALGDRDPYTEKAWQNALDRAAKFHAAGRDLTLDDVIDMGANLRREGGIGGGGPGGGAGGAGRAPLVTELANPEDLKYYAQKTAVSTLGRSLRPDELNRFVSSFHTSQSTEQAQAYAAGGTGGPGGTVVGAPNAQVAAETFARREAPVEAGAHDTVKVFDVVSKMLGGRRGAR
jgi:hypothetical protein